MSGNLDAVASGEIIVADGRADLPALPGLPQPEVERAKAYARGSRASSTRRTYESDWRHFTSWCAERGVAALPAAPATVAVYLAAEADRGLAAGTINRKMASIGWQHMNFGHLAPQRTPEGVAILSVIAGIRRAEHAPPVRKAPACADVVRDTLRAITGDSLHDHRDRVVIGLGMLSALRRSELVAVQLADIERRPDGIILHVPRSKGDQEGKGETIPILTGCRIKPIDLLDAWLNAAQITEGPVFRRISRCGANVHSVAMAHGRPSR